MQRRPPRGAFRVEGDDHHADEPPPWPTTATIRLRFGIIDALLEASGEAHCGLPAAELVKLAAELLAVERSHETTASSRVPLEPALFQGALDLDLELGERIPARFDPDPTEQVER